MAILFKFVRNEELNWTTYLFIYVKLITVVSLIVVKQ